MHDVYRFNVCFMHEFYKLLAIKIGGKYKVFKNSLRRRGRYSKILLSDICNTAVQQKVIVILSF